jgi:hypothetical protein
VTRAFTAIRLGFQQTLSRWASSLFAVLASIAEVLAGLTALLGAAAWLDGGEKSSAAAFGASVAGMLSARILLVLVHGGAVRQSGAWLTGQTTGSTMEEILAAGPKSLGWFAWMLPIDLFAALWKWLGVFAVLFGYAHALGARHAGCSASLAFSGYVTVLLLLALGWALLGRMTLVWTVRRPFGPFRASADALVALLQRPGHFLAVLITGIAGTAVVSAVVSLFASGLTPDRQGLEQVMMGQLTTGILIGFGSALFELVILYGFTALEADSPAPAATAL